MSFRDSPVSTSSSMLGLPAHTSMPGFFFFLKHRFWELNLDLCVCKVSALPSDPSLQFLFSRSSSSPSVFLLSQVGVIFLICAFPPLITISVFLHFTAIQNQEDLEPTSQGSKGGPLLWVEVSVSLCLLCSSPTILSNKSNTSQRKWLISYPPIAMILREDSWLPAGIISGCYYARRVSVSCLTCLALGLQNPPLLLWP